MEGWVVVGILCAAVLWIFGMIAGSALVNNTNMKESKEAWEEVIPHRLEYDELDTLLSLVETHIATLKDTNFRSPSADEIKTTLDKISTAESIQKKIKHMNLVLYRHRVVSRGA